MDDFDIEMINELSFTRVEAHEPDDALFRAGRERLHVSLRDNVLKISDTGLFPSRNPKLTYARRYERNEFARNNTIYATFLKVENGVSFFQMLHASPKPDEKPFGVLPEPLPVCKVWMQGSLRQLVAYGTDDGDSGKPLAERFSGRGWVFNAKEVQDSDSAHQQDLA